MAAKTQKSHYDTVVGKLGKKEKTAGTVGSQLGFKTHHGVSKALGEAVRRGDAVKTDKGYRKP